MKNFKYFILFLSLITIFEITNSKDANAVQHVLLMLIVR